MKNHTLANKCLVLSLLLTFTLGTMIVPMVGCGKVVQTLNTVLQKAPLVTAMINTGLDVANLVDANDPNIAVIKAQTAVLIPKIVAGVNQLVTTINSVNADIATAPPGTLQTAMGLYQGIDDNLTQWLALFNVGTNGQKGAAVVADFVDVFLGELAGFLPSGTAASAATTNVSAQSAVVKRTSLVKTQAALNGKKLKIVSVDAFVSGFNAQMKAVAPIQISAQ